MHLSDNFLCEEYSRDESKRLISRIVSFDLKGDSREFFYTNLVKVSPW